MLAGSVAITQRQSLSASDRVFWKALASLQAWCVCQLSFHDHVDALAPETFTLLIHSIKGLTYSANSKELFSEEAVVMISIEWARSSRLASVGDT